MMIPQDLSTSEQMFQNFLASHAHPLDERVNHDPSKFHPFKSSASRYLRLFDQFQGVYSDGREQVEIRLRQDV